MRVIGWMGGCEGVDGCVCEGGWACVRGWLGGCERVAGKGCRWVDGWGVGG